MKHPPFQTAFHLVPQKAPGFKLSTLLLLNGPLHSEGHEEVVARWHDPMDVGLKITYPLQLASSMHRSAQDFESGWASQIHLLWKLPFLSETQHAFLLQACLNVWNWAINFEIGYNSIKHLNLIINQFMASKLFAYHLDGRYMQMYLIQILLHNQLMDLTHLQSAIQAKDRFYMCIHEV